MELGGKKRAGGRTSVSQAAGVRVMSRRTLELQYSTLESPTEQSCSSRSEEQSQRSN